MKKKQSKFTGFLLCLFFMAGLSLLLYPSVANYVNSLNSSKAISDYTDSVARLSQEEYDKLWSAAQAYNEKLAQKNGAYNMSDAERAEYNSLLNISGNGVMGYIEIPYIDVRLPVYHGTEERTLQIAAGHLEWTSLPVGGLSTHCVLSGHRGLPSAKLFTDLDKLVEGDIFILRILNEVMTYSVDQILTVVPTNTADLQIVQGEDFCTLVTCTPYGINDHRLLIRGHRITNTEEAEMIWINAEAMQIEPVIVAAVIAIPILVIYVISVFIMNPVRKRRLAAKARMRNLRKLKQLTDKKRKESDLHE